MEEGDKEAVRANEPRNEAADGGKGFLREGVMIGLDLERRLDGYSKAAKIFGGEVNVGNR
jgi:hypothetical protein